MHHTPTYILPRKNMYVSVQQLLKNAKGKGRNVNVIKTIDVLQRSLEIRRPRRARDVARRPTAKRSINRTELANSGISLRGA